VDQYGVTFGTAVDQDGGDLNWPITSGESLQFRRDLNPQSFLPIERTFLPIYVTTLDNIYGRSLAGIAGSNLAGGMEVCLL
jgi:hypothetical protein